MVRFKGLVLSLSRKDDGFISTPISGERSATGVHGVVVRGLLAPQGVL